MLALLVYPLLAGSTRPYSCNEIRSPESFESSSDTNTSEYSTDDKSEKTAKYHKSEEKSQNM